MCHSQCIIFSLLEVHADVFPSTKYLFFAEFEFLLPMCVELMAALINC